MTSGVILACLRIPVRIGILVGVRTLAGVQTLFCILAPGRSLTLAWALLALLSPASADAVEKHLCANGLNIEGAVAYSRAHDQRALLIALCDELIVEDYSAGAAPTRNLRIASIAKNFWGLLALVAQEDRLFSIEDRASRYIQEWRGVPRKQDITIRQLLSMSSGLDPGFRQLYMRKPLNAPLTALQVPFDAPPGSMFSYGPSNMEVFGEILKRTLRSRGMPLPMEFLRDRLLFPLGISYEEWKTDKSGNPMMSGGVRMTPLDLLRLAQFVYQKGWWEGRQIIPSTSFDRNIRGTPANPSYGLTFWLNARAEDPSSREIDIEEALGREVPFREWESICLAKNAPPDMLAMIGSGNQRIYVIPSLSLVIVRMADGNTFSDGAFFKELMTEAVHRNR